MPLHTWSFFRLSSHLSSNPHRLSIAARALNCRPILERDWVRSGPCLGGGLREAKPENLFLIIMNENERPQFTEQSCMKPVKGQRRFCRDVD